MLQATITTVVRDAGQLGGGVADVAVNLHVHLAALSSASRLLCSIKPERAVNLIAPASKLEYDALLAGNQLSEIVHIHGIWTPFEWFAYRAARRRKAKVVVSPHGALEPWAFQHKGVKKRLAWRIYQRKMLQDADLLVVNSEQERQSLRTLGLRPPIAVIPNGVDTEGLLDTEQQQRRRIVLFLSRIDPKKGIPDLIRAWSSLLDHKGYALHIYGYGEKSYVRKIKDLIDAEGIGDISLREPAFGSSRWKVFSTASIYVLPSYSENFGITVAEALTAGLPIITTTSTPWSHLSSLGLGWVVENDIHQLRDALLAAISLPDRDLGRMSENATSFAKEHFGWGAVIRQYMETYNWLSSSSKPPSWIDLRLE